MESIDELLERCEQAHGHVCAGQLLGVRMALLGCDCLGITDPRGADRKKLMVWVEIDRCMTDAVGAVTGTRLGKRTLKFLDYGKVAATFMNVDTGEAVRIVARESARDLADRMHPEIESKKHRQMITYREASDADLFSTSAVDLTVNEMDLPGHPRSRAVCQECGEGINDGRELNTVDQGILCHPCAFGTYYQTKSEPILVLPQIRQMQKSA
ncbi:MAG TPA: FmdE family protein [Pyrinomonadaceae bacterium]|nr:FmdE family protein [Pyrinomonadaceae bacterium]